MSDLAKMCNVDYRDLAVWIIDSDFDSRERTKRLIQGKVLPEDTEVRIAEHPEVVRRELELMSTNDKDAKYSQNLYNIFLSKTRFQNFNSLFGSRTCSFDDEKSVRKLDDHTGIFKMLRGYWNFLTQEGAKFFNAFLIDSSDANPQMYDDYNKNIHLANYPYPNEQVDSKKITQIQLIDGDDYEEFSSGQLKKMFEHFDKLVEADSFK